MGANQAAPPSAGEIAAAMARLRVALGHNSPAHRLAANLAEAFRKIGSSSGLIRAVASRLGWSEESLRFSLPAMLDPFIRAGDLEEFARSLRARRKIFGFVMAGNIPGAGLHEVVAALLAGCAVMIKTATAEPIFFATFADTLFEIDPEFGERIVVFNWPRERGDLTDAMRAACDVFVAFGDDATVARLRAPFQTGNASAFAGFDARVSGIAIARGALDQNTISEAAKDIVRFEQRGCLSPHHMFVEAPDGAIEAAAQLAAELQKTSSRIPPSRRLSLEEGAAIRRAREIARWRSIGGQNVRLWEGGDLGWTVIYDANANFTQSPGYRTIFVSPFRDSIDLERRLAPVGGRIEGFALAAKSRRDEIASLLRKSGATYVCEPGRMQSPPLDWPHGGGAFLRVLRDGE